MLLGNGQTVAFGSDFLDDLSARALSSPRRRQHHNIHASYNEPCQRFLNAIEPGSYLRPSRNVSLSRGKLLAALRGQFASVLFDDAGEIIKVLPFGAGDNRRLSLVIDLAPGDWNTTLSLAAGSVLLEVKAGPFDPMEPMEFAPWAPCEGSVDAGVYSKWLEETVKSCLAGNYASD